MSHLTFAVPEMAAWWADEVVAFVKHGGDGVDGLFLDGDSGFPADGGPWVVEALNVSEADQRIMENASATAVQTITEALVADGKHLWHAFQAANDIGKHHIDGIGVVTVNNASAAYGNLRHPSAFWTILASYSELCHVTLAPGDRHILLAGPC